MVEEWLFFRQYRFHQQKIAFHRASMQYYRHYLQQQGYTVHYTEALQPECDIRQLVPLWHQQGVRHIHCCDPSDDWLLKRLQHSAHQAGIALSVYDSPLFINTLPNLEQYFKDKIRYFQTDFYVQQRKSRRVLLEAGQKPVGGKWSFDTENRLRYPKDKHPPALPFSHETPWHTAAAQYTSRHFSAHYGKLDSPLRYPVTHEASEVWLQAFIHNRLAEFGPYEDAIVVSQHVLHHSVLTPMLNVGLLTPNQILEAVLQPEIGARAPMSSLEGFVRQVLGWREFIRGVYAHAGARQRTTNFWKFTRPIPETFWTGDTGITPVDAVIRKVLRTGYCHHIERLMVLGNFMLLCEFDPNEVYRWFMELFIDAYDWVMVPNVYGMSQFADGGLMATKPYISGSNYLMKMSDFPSGPWQRIWDGLFWRFMHTHRNFFLQNPRLGMLVNTFDKMPEAKRQAHLEAAEQWLDSLNENSLRPA